jgi:lipoyl(octanoyl) transferase
MFQDLVAYVEAWEWQKLRVEDKVRGLAVDEDVNDTLIILQHPSVYTLGTRSSEAFLKFDAKNPPFELHRTERGGEVRVPFFPFLRIILRLCETCFCIIDRASNSMDFS